MKSPNEPLEYPQHYPPTDRWKKFFIGVRWLGPDLSFFRDLKQQQSARTSECMKVWDQPERESLAIQFGNSSQKWLRWPTPYFLPNDKFLVIAGGSKFDMIDGLEFAEVIKETEKYVKRCIPNSLWESSVSKTLGEVVDEILAMTNKA